MFVCCVVFGFFFFRALVSIPPSVRNASKFGQVFACTVASAFSFFSDYSFAADIRDVKTSDEDMMETMMIAFYLND